MNLLNIPRKAAVKVEAKALQANTMLDRVFLEFAPDAIFKALTVNRYTPEEIQLIEEQTENAREVIPAQWNIWRQKKDVGRVPVRVENVELVLLKNATENYIVHANVYGHDLAFQFQDGENGGENVPKLTEDGKLIPVDALGNVKKPGAEPVFLMQLAVRRRTQGGRTYFSVEPVNENGQGAVVDKKPRTPTVDPETKQIVARGNQWDLNQESVPGLPTLIIGALNAEEPDPSITAFLEKMEVETGGGASAVAAATAQVGQSKLTGGNSDTSDLAEEE